jgi:hypothetical protein
MRVGRRVEYNSIGLLSRSLNGFDELTLFIDLLIAQFGFGKFLFELFEIVFKRFAAVKQGLSLAQEIQIGTVDNYNFFQ